MMMLGSCARCITVAGVATAVDTALERPEFVRGDRRLQHRCMGCAALGQGIPRTALRTRARHTRRAGRDALAGYIKSAISQSSSNPARHPARCRSCRVRYRDWLCCWETGVAGDVGVLAEWEWLRQPVVLIRGRACWGGLDRQARPLKR